ncbi:divalent-cation tolerance protein CutA [Tsuneonella deserti]|uniref:Divalent-cation tolerance protein CutA n=1 Tax=Tsuneonella deserti TaxID=2035528 RepID=A0ABQ1SCL9_9SPHN|nr:divalent-cation tolerance protein CutA [Tsuneonella deserti]GGE04227.1 divalent-cation tolerance protein CutA [Tsuneonella deserti]
MTALIWCPFPDEDSAVRAANQLLDEKLIACANLIGTVRSLYQWNDERGDARETGALFKTDAALLEKAVARLEQIHPYEAPAILGWRCDAAAPATAQWLAELGK